MGRVTTLLFGLALAVLSQSAATQIVPGMTIHRNHAGVKDASGWYPAKSTNGSFGVRMPVQFVDFSSAGGEEDVTGTWAVGAKTSEGIKFLAMRVAYGAGEVTAKRKFKGFQDGTLGDGRQASKVTALTVQSHPAVDLVFENGSYRAWFRAVLSGRDLILLSIEEPRQYDKVVEPLVGPFLESLTFDAVRASAAPAPQ